jgi:glycine/D-amino acid oxidase-like deaminating enzyme
MLDLNLLKITLFPNNGISHGCFPFFGIASIDPDLIRAIGWNRPMKNPIFPIYKQPCGWNALLPSREARSPATGQLDVQYVVVGAGFTGMAAARRLSELNPNADIVLLEASTVGEGSSARNSGFLTREEYPSSNSAASIEQNRILNGFNREAFDHLKRIIDDHQIACDFHTSGRIRAAATPEGANTLRKIQQALEATGHPTQTLEAPELHRLIGTSYYKFGVHTDTGHLVQPAALIRGMLSALPQQVQVHENSPVIDLKRHGKRWVLKTSSAQITADRVILATNPSVKFFGYLQDRVVTIHTYAAITERLKPSEIASLGSLQSWGVLPAHRLGTTVRRVGADRLLVRSLYAYENSLSDSVVHDALSKRFHNRYPDLSHIRLEHVWGGVTALTLNGSPYAGCLEPGLYASAGCNGSGIVKGTALGSYLAEVAHSDISNSQILKAYGTANKILPDPFRALGFKVISAWESRKAGLES